MPTKMELAALEALFLRVLDANAALCLDVEAERQALARALARAFMSEFPGR